MKPNNHQAPPPEHSRSTKRKLNLNSERFDGRNRQVKRQMLTVLEGITQTTVTRNPDPAQELLTSNRFEAIHPFRKRSKRRKRRKSSTTDERYRQWTFSSREFSNFKDKFVVVSYNILGVENALKHPDLYMEVPHEFLEWNKRKKLICKEIKRYNASILCFQEVDRFDDLNNRLRKDGFRGVYKARTGDAYDGCAIFWKDKLFTLLHQESIEFQKFGLRNNVAQLCVLKMNQNLPEHEICEQMSKQNLCRSQSLVVGNTHVLFNPNRGDIKLGQVRLFLEKAYKLSREWGRIPVLLAGDLNSGPRSAIYQFLASSELDVQRHDRRYMSRQVDFISNCRDSGFQNGNRNRSSMAVSRPLIYEWSDEELRLATGSEQVTQLRHQLKLQSAYLGVPGSRRTRDNYGEPLATSYHSKFMGTVDYIWHTEELLPVRVLETLPVDILKRTAGLPSKRWGSDHLALVCELAFTNGSDRT